MQEIAFDRTPNLSELHYAREHGLEELLLKTRSTREQGRLQAYASENAPRSQSSEESDMLDGTDTSDGSTSDSSESSDDIRDSSRGDSELETSV